MLKSLLIATLSLCFSWLAEGQPAQHWSVAVLANQPSSTVQITNFFNNTFLWWHSADVPNGNVVSNQWADRIQGKLLQQGDATKRTTNSINGDGVYFNGTTFLTNDVGTFNPLATPRYSVLFVLKQDTGSPDTHSTITWDSVYSISTDGFRLVGNTNWTHQIAGSAHNYSVTNIAAFPFDMLIAGTNFSAGEQPYTNGVSGGIEGYQLGNDNFNIKWVGAGNNSGTDVNHYKGWIRDIIVWTNAPFSASDISNSHYWVTKTYPDITP